MGAQARTYPLHLDTERRVGLGKPCFGPLYGSLRAPMDLQAAHEAMRPLPQKRRPKSDDIDAATLVVLPQMRLPPRYALTKTGKRAQCHMHCTLPVFATTK